MSASYSSSSSYFYSSSSSTDDGTTATGQRYATVSQTEPDGTTTVRTYRQDLGEPAIVDEERYDQSGQLLTAGNSSAGGTRRITDLDEEEGGEAYD
ncbi:hypothetical protein P875_00042603 [Aspergillus parasiticus SU-1]|uniref:Uncharacterized protein n=3 Tax=Aspergillus subgen. Circumdati TaxID=2720871 RepID=A0A5N6DMA1_ASPPA|nr:hypothetical protein BDV34DRAFT_194063 [Aspergillus parasiticus]KAE8325790.1 hypothetical protein BDV39DRAFT_178327 [Aspergillus sergii]KJK61141.1 hypothetical protein P875_00042603 [Aspergillus parasiticus SU-1]